MIDLILHKARLRASPFDAVAIANGAVAAIGPGVDLLQTAGPDTRIIDCGGCVVIPGIVDDHCHLFATAARGVQVDCRPQATPNVPAVIAALRAVAMTGDVWLRGYGYDDSPIGLGRHLNRHDLDVVSAWRPIRVDHRSGHASVLNSAGLDAAGIGRDTTEPPGGVIERGYDGEPTGLLLDLAGWLRERIGEPSSIDAAAFGDSLADLGRRLLNYGITAVTDAGPDNGLRRWRDFVDAVGNGLLPQRVTMMAGCNRLGELQGAGLSYGDSACDGRLTVGHAKIMLTATSGRLAPSPEELADTIAAAHRMGYPVAIHAVERDAIVAAALALSENPAPVGHDRIEHCAECPPDVAELVSQSRARVVVNTGFLHYDGERYRRTVSADLLPHLYPAGALAASGIPVGLASDAPVVEPNPWAAMAAAITRQSAEGVALGGVPVPSIAKALRMHMAYSRIAPSSPADLAVVEPNPFSLQPEDLVSVRAVAAIVAGRVAWPPDI